MRVAPERIEYAVTLIDPTTWTRPWAAVIALRRTNDKAYEFDCHEGEREVLTDILAGARANEGKKN